MARKSLTVERVQDDLFVKGYRGGIQLTKSEAEELVSLLKPYLKTAKYKNEIIEAYGRKWDSKVELEYYEYLRARYTPERVIIQPRYELQAPFKQNGKSVRAITYSADFAIDGTNLVFDVKGIITQQGKMRIKMFQQKYPHLTLSLINKCPKYLHSKYGDWITFEDLQKERKIKKKSQSS